MFKYQKVISKHSLSVIPKYKTVWSILTKVKVSNIKLDNQLTNDIEENWNWKKKEENLPPTLILFALSTQYVKLLYSLPLGSHVKMK